MPNAIPTLGSFLNSSQYNTNLTSGNPLEAALVAGSTFNLPAFSSTVPGGVGSAEKDPGGLRQRDVAAETRGGHVAAPRA